MIVSEPERVGDPLHRRFQSVEGRQPGELTASAALRGRSTETRGSGTSATGGTTRRAAAR